jgi:hypothetical protein
LRISVESPTIKKIIAINKKTAPTNPDQIFGLKVPLEIYVHNRIDSKKILTIKKKAAILEKKYRGL